MTSAPNLAKALAAAQADLKGAIKDSTNPHFKSSYADLASVWAAWQAVGPKNGLSIAQRTTYRDGVTILITTMMHTSGESIEGEYPLLPAKPNDPQALGGAMTYARRYCLAAMVGICPEDDDGNAASNVGAQSQAPVVTQSKRTTPPPRQITAVEAAALASLIERADSDAEKVCAHYKVANLLAMNIDQHDSAMVMLNNKIAKAAPNANA